MTHKKDIIDMAILGLKQGGLEYAEVYRPFLERIYDSGFNEGNKSVINPYTIKPGKKDGCKICGIGSDGKAYGYVCIREDCPTRVSC